jgi:hypothetical protein
VVLNSAGGTSAGSGNWGSGFLPSSYQGVPFRSVGDPVLYLSNPPGIEVRSLELAVDQNNSYGLPIGLDVIVGDAYITVIKPFIPPM